MTHAELELECDADAYKEMRAQYRRLCADHPTISRYILARSAGCRAFGVEPDDLMTGLRSHEVSQARQKIMAAMTIVIAGVNFRAVGRMFGKTHGSVIYASHQYGDAARHALGVVIL